MQLGLTQKEFGTLCDGLSESAVSLIEREERTDLRWATMEKLAHGVDVSTVDEFVEEATALAEGGVQKEATTRPGAGNTARKTSKATS